MRISEKREHEMKHTESTYKGLFDEERARWTERVDTTSRTIGISSELEVRKHKLCKRSRAQSRQAFRMET